MPPHLLQVCSLVGSDGQMYPNAGVEQEPELNPQHLFGGEFLMPPNLSAVCLPLAPLPPLGGFVAGGGFCCDVVKAWAEYRATDSLACVAKW